MGTAADEEEGMTTAAAREVVTADEEGMGVDEEMGAVVIGMADVEDGSVLVRDID